jgi:hypothetical protein
VCRWCAEGISEKQLVCTECSNSHPHGGM